MDIELGGRTPAARAARAGLVERTVSVTISAGVAESRGGAEPRQVAEAAERALERARQAGMNRVSR
jgi:PleD family two-component response regulator